MNKKIEIILKKAILAPSGDNCQPWFFDVDGMTIKLFNDPLKDRSLYNLKQRASLISHGAILENIVQSAPEVGLNADIRLFPDEANQNHIATIKFSNGETIHSDLSLAIPKRHTNREKFIPFQLSAQQLNIWSKLTNIDEGKIWITSEQDQIREISSLLSLNDRLVMEVAPLHKFLFNQIRWNENEVTKTGDGLDIKTLGLNLIDQSSFKVLKHFGITSVLNKLGLKKIIELKAKALISTASAIAIISIPGTSGEDYVRGGMLWQRLLLQLASDELTAQPIAGLACLMQSAQENLANENFTKNQLNQLLNIRKELFEICNLEENSNILTIFRIGKGPKVARAIRRPLNSFIKP